MERDDLKPIPQRYADFAIACKEVQDLCRETLGKEALDLMGWPMNLDMLMVDIGPRTHAGVAARAAKRYGAAFQKVDSARYLAVDAPLGGHGAGRRTQLEWMARALCQRGFRAWVRYLDD